VVTVLVYRDDGCAGHYFYGDGYADAQTIRIASDLRSAQMDATVSVCDLNFECFDAVIHVTWAATGKPQRQVNNTHYVGPGHVIVISHSGDTFVPATAVGSVSDGTLNLAPNPAQGPASAFMGKFSVIFIDEFR